MMDAPAPYFTLRDAQVFQADQQVFESLTLTLNLGENCCILGPNGAGKSTLLKLLFRQLHPVVKANSEITWFNQARWVTADLKQHFGLVSQDFQNQYDAHVRGYEVVLSGLFSSVGVHKHMGITDAHRQAAEDVMDAFAVTDLCERRFWHLSTGQQRRLLLARAMINKPKVLILDEPTNGLDLPSAFDLIDRLRKLCRSGTTLLLVTHHLPEVIPEITRIITLKDGALMDDDDKSNVLTSDKLSALFQARIGVGETHGFFHAYPI